MAYSPWSRTHHQSVTLTDSQLKLGNASLGHGRSVWPRPGHFIVIFSSNPHNHPWL